MAERGATMMLMGTEKKAKRGAKRGTKKVTRGVHWQRIVVVGSEAKEGSLEHRQRGCLCDPLPPRHRALVLMVAAAKQRTMARMKEAVKVAVMGTVMVAAAD